MARKLTNRTADESPLRRIRVTYQMPRLSSETFSADVVLERGHTDEGDLPAMLSVKHFSHYRHAPLIRVVSVTDLAAAEVAA